MRGRAPNLGSSVQDLKIGTHWSLAKPSTSRNEVTGTSEETLKSMTRVSVIMGRYRNFAAYCSARVKSPSTSHIAVIITPEMNELDLTRALIQFITYYLHGFIWFVALSSRMFCDVLRYISFTVCLSKTKCLIGFFNI